MTFGKMVLEGGDEFNGQMAAPDLQALKLAGGLDVPVVIIPAAAAPDHNHWRAGANGLRWFRQIGAQNVTVSNLIDAASASQFAVTDQLSKARLIYLLGGFPGYLADTLRGSPAWEAILLAHHNGAVIAGSSAGAMVLCEHLYDPVQTKVCEGLGLLPGTCFLPHHNTFGQTWVSRLSAQLPGRILLGVDEQTGLVADGQAWQVLGAGQVVLYQGDEIKVFSAGELLPEGSLPC